MTPQLTRNKNHRALTIVTLKEEKKGTCAFSLLWEIEMPEVQGTPDRRVRFVPAC